LTAWAGIFDALDGDLGDVDQALDAVFDLGEGAEVGELGDLGVGDGARGVALGERLPRVGGQLLDAEAEALVLDVDVEDDGLDLVALLVDLGGVADLLGPGEVGDVDEAVDALLDPRRRCRSR
jgi:hypothetical protein